MSSTNTPIRHQAYVTLNATGQGTITIDGVAEILAGTDIATNRTTARRRIERTARAAGTDIPFTVTEPDGSRDLIAHPNGSITAAVADDAPGDDHPTDHDDATTAAWTQQQTTQPSPAPAPTPQPSPSGRVPAEQQHNPHPLDEAAGIAPMPGLENHLQESNPTPPPTQQPADDDPRWKEIQAQPATTGLRGLLHLSPSAAELDQRRAAYRDQLATEQRQYAQEQQRRREQAEQETRRAERAREKDARDRKNRDLIQTNFQGPRTIVTANLKGGQRKTSSTFLLGATFGRICGGYVAAWDANETMGNLGDRAVSDLHTNTVVDLLEQAADDFTSVDGARLGTVLPFIRPQGDNHFHVLASDEDPTRQDIVDGAGFNTVHEILSRFYTRILVDTGNNIRTAHFLAAIDAADQLVIPMTVSEDGAQGARTLIKSLDASGHSELVDNAVLLLHDLTPQTPMNKDAIASIVGEFQDRVAAIVPIPYDPALEGGAPIDYDALADTTREAYIDAAAKISTSMRNTFLSSARHDHRAPHASA